MSDTVYPRSFGPYVLLERLGQGGMSEVDLARRATEDAAFVRFCVIKRIHAQHQGDDSFVRMFHDEARINAELQHENIATVYDFGLEGDEFFLAMEYVPGCDLRRVQRLLVRRGEHFPLRIACRITADVLAALEYAHSRVDTFGKSMNIVHRDVNPRNVMLSTRGEVKLIDFGVAKADNRAEHTVGHSLKGKFAYMAPEQIDAKRTLDGRADVFAMGIVLHELLVGASPFAGLTEVQTMHRILQGQIPPVISAPGRPIPDSLINVHDKALAVSPDQRFRSAGAMRAAILSVLEDLGGVPTQKELSEFLRQVDPDTGSVSQRLEDWRSDTPSDGSVSRRLPPPPPEQTSSSGTLATTQAAAPPRTNPLVLGAVIGGVLGVVLLVGLAGGAWFGGQDRDVTPATTTPAAATPAAATPAAATPAAATPAAATPAAASPAASTPAAATPAAATPAAATPATGSSSGSSTAGSSTAGSSTAGSSNAGSSTAAPTTSAPSTSAPTTAQTAPAQTAEAEPQPQVQITIIEETPEPAATGSSAEPAASGGSGQTDTASSGSGTTTDPEPAAVAPTGGATGYLNISSRPTGLQVSIDGRTYGHTPVRAVELPVGAHAITVTDPAGGQSWTKRVSVEEGRTQLVLLGDGS